MFYKDEHGYQVLINRSAIVLGNCKWGKSLIMEMKKKKRSRNSTEVSVVIFMATARSCYELTPHYEHRPRGYLLLRLVYATRLLLHSHYLLVSTSHPVHFYPSSPSSLQPAGTHSSTFKPDQLRCSSPLPRVCALCLSSLSVSRADPLAWMLCRSRSNYRGVQQAERPIRAAGKVR